METIGDSNGSDSCPEGSVSCLKGTEEEGFVRTSLIIDPHFFLSTEIR